MTVQDEINEIMEYLKKYGFSREERRQWIRTIKKEARIK